MRDISEQERLFFRLLHKEAEGYRAAGHAAAVLYDGACPVTVVHGTPEEVAAAVARWADSGPAHWAEE